MKESERIHGYHLVYDETDELNCKGVRDFKVLSSEEAERLFSRARDKKADNEFKGRYDRRYLIRYSSTRGKYYLERDGHSAESEKEIESKKKEPYDDTDDDYYADRKAV